MEEFDEVVNVRMKVRGSLCTAHPLDQITVTTSLTETKQKRT